MKFGEADVRRAAAFARLPLAPGRAATLTAELAPLVTLLDALRHVRPEPSGGAVGVGAGGMPLRADAGPPYDLVRSPRELAASTRAGYVIVPRPPSEAAPRGAAASPAFDDAVGDDAFDAEMEAGP